ncbi:hypothetical protein F4679DRAFT_218468 [Xylaria curta]|nr:hypothetical protein F4679DRAFT_218468 [Xylaria curta]
MKPLRTSLSNYKVGRASRRAPTAKQLWRCGQLWMWRRIDYENITGKREETEGFKAGVMYFKKSESGNNAWKGHSHKNCKETYPNQKLSMRKILHPKNTKNPLTHMPHGDELRYFHFPANNMEWIEKAMHILFGDDPAKPDTTTQTGKILARGFWRGRMYGSGERGITSHGTRHAKKLTTGPIHARHMRSRFSAIPRETPTKASPRLQDSMQSISDRSKNGGKDIAAFLPYSTGKPVEDAQKWLGLWTKQFGPRDRGKVDHQNLAEIMEKKRKSTSKKPEYRHHIGNYLMAVAKVAKEMDYEDDEILY